MREWLYRNRWRLFDVLIVLMFAGGVGDIVTTLDFMLSEGFEAEMNPLIQAMGPESLPLLVVIRLSVPLVMYVILWWADHPPLPRWATHYMLVVLTYGAFKSITPVLWNVGVIETSGWLPYVTDPVSFWLFPLLTN